MNFYKFSDRELRCKCGCGKMNMSFEFMDKLIAARLISDTPYILTSACRCDKRNKDEGGKPNSSHLSGLAVDIAVVDSRTRFRVLKGLFTVGFHRIGIGSNFIHVDDDTTKDKEVVWLY